MLYNLPTKPVTVKEIVDNFNNGMSMYDSSFDSLLKAKEEMNAAKAMANLAHPNISLYTKGYSRFDNTSEVTDFYNAIILPEKEQFISTAKKLHTLATWQYVLERLGIKEILDADGKKKFFEDVQYGKDLPEITEENIKATIQETLLKADFYFRRGLANCFSKLERRFKSHDGWKIGSRIIVTGLVDESGFIKYGWKDDVIYDVERVFKILDNKQDYTSIINKIRDERKSWTVYQSDHDSDYFKIRIYKNGNAHLWFKRDDLVTKVNKILAEYYGEVLSHDGKEDDIFENKNLTPAKKFGFYPTPEKVADRVVNELWTGRLRDNDVRILEPSAGTGNLAKALWKVLPDAKVDAYEIQKSLYDDLKLLPFNNLWCADFLLTTPNKIYDAIIMNPPFDMQRDIDHVTHALKFLKKDGMLVSVMSAGTEFRENKKCSAFRELVKNSGGRFYDLPNGSFSESGTYVNTVICVIKGR